MEQWIYINPFVIFLMRNILVKIIGMVILVLTVLSLVIGFMNYEYLADKVDRGISTYGSWGIFLIVVFLEVVPQYLSPHILIVSASLFGVDIWSTLLAMITGAIIGSLVGFEIGKRNGKSFVEGFVKKKDFDKLEKGMNNIGKWIVLIAALTPVPYIPLVIGALNMDRKKFIYWGTLPRCFALTIFIYYVL